MFQRLSTDLLQSGYGVRFRPGGFSMYPTIKDGEIVTVEPVKAREVKRGDILLYQTTGRVIAHRVVGIEEDGNAARVFILRGDSLASCDAPVSGEQVLGRVVSVERKGRNINLEGRRAGIRSALSVRVVRIGRGLSLRLGILKSLKKPARRIAGS